MASFTQLPGSLDLAFVKGDEISFAMDFAADLTDYDLEAAVYNSASAQTPVVAPITIDVIDIEAGTMTLSLTETQTDALGANGRYRWYFRWITPGGVTRTVVSGNVSILNP